MRFSITYRAEYRYSKPVSEQHNAVRVRPADGPAQRVEDFELTVDPSARLFRHRDYFGTEVTEFNVADRHPRLNIEARSSVATEPSPQPQAGRWSEIDSDRYREAAAEFLLADPPPPKVAELAGIARRETPLETLLALCELIPDRFEYRPGATFVGSTVDDLLRIGAGVCQDFVHLALAVARSEGLGARYVSGYLFVPDGDQHRSAEVDTHAWIEVLIPGAEGDLAWVGADPTNRYLTGERHVKIGHGRAYDDVPPIKGVYRGITDADHEVAVTMIDLGPS